MIDSPTYRLLSASCLAFLLLAVLSCSQVEQYEGKPNSIGQANQVLVLADEELWQTNLRDTLEYYYESPYPILPQPEPNFNLKQHTWVDLISRPALKELRTFLVLANLSDEESAVTQMVLKDLGEETVSEALQERPFGIKVARDKWAENQLLVYLFARNHDRLVEGAITSYPAIAERIRTFDEGQIEATVYLEGENNNIMNDLREEWGVSIRIPVNFEVAISEYPFLWLRYERPSTSSSLLFYRLPYVSQDQFTEDYLISLRDSLTAQYISSDARGSYMRVNDEDLPVFFYETEVNGNYAVEARGIWEMENDFMGGPFVSFLIHDRVRNELLFVDGFVYGPGEEKRDLMQKLRYIIRTTRLNAP